MRAAEACRRPGKPTGNPTPRPPPGDPVPRARHRRREAWGWTHHQRSASKLLGAPPWLDDVVGARCDQTVRRERRPALLVQLRINEPFEGLRLDPTELFGVDDSQADLDSDQAFSRAELVSVVPLFLSKPDMKRCVATPKDTRPATPRSQATDRHTDGTTLLLTSCERRHASTTPRPLATHPRPPPRTLSPHESCTPAHGPPRLSSVGARGSRQ